MAGGKVLEETYRKWVQYKEECVKMMENEPLPQGTSVLWWVTVKDIDENKEIRKQKGHAVTLMTSKCSKLLWQVCSVTGRLTSTPAGQILLLGLWSTFPVLSTCLGLTKVNYTHIDCDWQTEPAGSNQNTIFDIYIKKKTRATIVRDQNESSVFSCLLQSLQTVGLITWSFETVPAPVDKNSNR